MFAARVRLATGQVERNPSALLGDGTPSPPQGTKIMPAATVPFGLTLPHLILGIGCRKIC
jgi:hypothetical protein